MYDSWKWWMVLSTSFVYLLHVPVTIIPETNSQYPVNQRTLQFLIFCFFSICGLYCCLTATYLTVDSWIGTPWCFPIQVYKDGYWHLIANSRSCCVMSGGYMPMQAVNVETTILSNSGCIKIGYKYNKSSKLGETLLFYLRHKHKIHKHKNTLISAVVYRWWT